MVAVSVSQPASWVVICFLLGKSGWFCVDSRYGNVREVVQFDLRVEALLVGPSSLFFVDIQL
jgi:hypothetical protein